MPDLAAIIDSWERLSTASMDGYSDQGRLNHLRLLARFRDQHFATLLAVAKAAVEAERLTAIFRREYITAPPDADSTAWTQRAWAASGEADDAIEKLFAAVRGDAATGEGR
jgi:hypothetical protein